MLTARVLGSRTYWMDRESDLAPIDLAIGWGKMSDSAYLDHIRIEQQGRWYFFRADSAVMSAGDINQNSANMHIIPATEYIKRVVNSLPVGSVVQLNGYLVEAKAGDGWTWRSSLSRGDTGDGSCELMLVTQITRLH